MSAFEIEIDELMRGIREEVRQKREQEVGRNLVAPSVDADPPCVPPLSGGSPPFPALDSSVIDEALDKADKVHAVGENLPAMTQQSGFRRIFATSVARMFLRLAQIITRDQRQFNSSLLVVLREMHDRIRSLHNGLAAEKKQRVARLEALERRLTEVQESAARQVEALERRLTEVQESKASRIGNLSE